MTGMPTPVQPLDVAKAHHSEKILSAATSIRTRRNPSSFAALCLIDLIQREHAALMASMHYDECAQERRHEEALDIQASQRHQHPLG
jgi:hypothetical protein